MKDLHEDYRTTANEVVRKVHLARASAMDERGLRIARQHIVDAENAISHFIQEHSESGLNPYDMVIQYSWFKVIEDTSKQLFGGRAA